MIKIYAESTTEAIVILKNDKIENQLEHVEHILTAIVNITRQSVWRYARAKGSKIVIELSMGDENIDNINESLEKSSVNDNERRRTKYTKTGREGN